MTPPKLYQEHIADMKPYQQHSQLIHILHVKCVIQCILTIKWAREKKMVLRKSQGEHIYASILQKSLHITGPLQFKFMLFEGQL